jgi:hypothetical protein
MEKIPRRQESFTIEKSPLKEAYILLNAKSPLELNNLYSEEDQKLIKTHMWDYDNPDLITNKIKEILERVDVSALSEEEQEWRNEILWFWNHHAISCAIWRYKDQRAAQEYSERALEFQSTEHPNQITRLFYFLTRDQLDEAEKWVREIHEEPEKSTAADLISWYKKGDFYKDQAAI